MNHLQPTVTLERTVPICPHCERECGSFAGLARHAKKCATRPDRDQLEELIEQGLPRYRMAEKFGMGTDLLDKCLDEAGLKDDPALMNRSRTKAIPLDILPGLAPMFGADCRICDLKNHCTETVKHGDNNVDWLPCEAPEVQDARANGRRWPTL